MKICFIGGTGTISTAISRKLLKEGHELYLINRGNRNDVLGTYPNLHSIVCDVNDEQALINALNTEMIRGAAIDVAKEEPLSAGNPLWSAKNLMITPHRAAYGDQMGNKMCALIEKNIHHYLKGETLEDRIL